MGSKELVLELVIALAPQYGVDPALAAAVIQVESSFNIDARGSAGEIGLFQLHPKYHTQQDLSNVLNNIHIGLKYLDTVRKMCYNMVGKNAWVACYNVGPRGAKKLKDPANFVYVRKVNQWVGVYGKSLQGTKTAVSGAQSLEAQPHSQSRVSGPRVWKRTRSEKTSSMYSLWTGERRI